MKLRLEAPVAKLTVDLPDEQVFEILGIALDYATGFSPEESPAVKESPKPVIPVIPKKVPDPPTPAPVVSMPVLQRNPKVPAPPSKDEFSGFLYIQCEECKTFKGFMPKKPISQYKCDCGHTTILKDMKVLRVDCKCGQKFRYLTNAKDSLISIDCYACGAPVDLEYHDKKGEYNTFKTE